MNIRKTTYCMLIITYLLPGAVVVAADRSGGDDFWASRYSDERVVKESFEFVSSKKYEKLLDLLFFKRTFSEEKRTQLLNTLNKNGLTVFDIAFANKDECSLALLSECGAKGSERLYVESKIQTKAFGGSFCSLEMSLGGQTLPRPQLEE